MEKLTQFFNIRTDFGFKKMFGTLKNKRILIRFLNALLGDEIVITDVRYHDKEVLPAEEKGKRIIYDIYFTTKAEGYDYYSKDSVVESPDDEMSGDVEEKKETDGKHHFIVEMQNQHEPPFEDRIFYYTLKMLASQGVSGWDYRLEPVVTVVVTNFDLPGMKPVLKHEFVAADRNTGDLLTDKMRIFFLSLRQMGGKRWEDCNTELEKLLYLIRNMDRLTKESPAYMSPEYREIFDAAETDRLNPNEVIAYSESLQRLRSTQASVVLASRNSFAEGMEKGKEKEMLNSIRIMDSFGIPHWKIAESYGMSEQDIAEILNGQSR